MPTHLNIDLLISLVAFAAASAWAAVSDFSRYIIPNASSLIIVLAFGAAAVSMPISFAFGGLAVGASVFLISAALFAAGRMGGGDAKLVASVSLWAGPTLFTSFAVAVCLSAFALSALMLSPLRTLLPAAPASAIQVTGSNTGVRRPMPFGIAIAVGGFYVLARRLLGG